MSQGSITHTHKLESSLRTCRPLDLWNLVRTVYDILPPHQCSTPLAPTLKGSATSSCTQNEYVLPRSVWFSDRLYDVDVLQSITISCLEQFSATNHLKSSWSAPSRPLTLKVEMVPFCFAPQNPSLTNFKNHRHSH